MINPLKRIINIALLLPLAAMAYGQSTKEPIQITDLLKIKTVGDVVLSSDGKQVVFTVKSIIKDAENPSDYDYNTQLWITQSEGKARPRQLTSGRESASQAVYSPNGKRRTALFAYLYY